MTTVGHNSKRAKAGPVSGGRLKSFVERVEKLNEEIEAIQQDRRDVYAEAKGVGYDIKTVRWLVSERKIDVADRSERDTLRDTYAHALGMAVDLVDAGMSLRQAESITGVSKSSIQRARAVPDCPSVEMTEDDLGDYLMLVAIEEDRIQASEIMYETLRGSREMIADDLGDPFLVIDKPRAQFREKIRAAAASVSCRKAPEASATVSAPAPVDSWDDIAAEHADLDAKRRAFLARASA